MGRQAGQKPLDTDTIVAADRYSLSELTSPHAPIIYVFVMVLGLGVVAIASYLEIL